LHDALPISVDATLQQEFQLLGATAEDERVAALEAHHTLVLPRQVHQQLVDLRLRQAVVAAGLADVMAATGAGQKRHQVVADQAVVDHRIGLLQQAPGAQGEQARIARTCSDQGNFTGGKCGAQRGGEYVWLVHADSCYCSSGWRLRLAEYGSADRWVWLVYRALISTLGMRAGIGRPISSSLR